MDNPVTSQGIGFREIHGFSRALLGKSLTPTILTKISHVELIGMYGSY